MASESDIIYRESGGNPYIGFGGVDLSGAPLDPYGFPIWKGRMGPQGISHAAGLYQFQPATWRAYAAPLGITDFSPASQKKVYDAARAAEGEKPWAASAPGGGDKMQSEGQYGGALHLNVQPHDPVADALLSGIIAQAPKQETQEKPQGEPLDFLNSILARAAAPQQQQAPAPQQQQHPKPVEPIPPPANVLAQTPPLAPMEAPQRPPIPATPAVPQVGGPVPPQPTPAVAAVPPLAPAPNPLERVLGITPAAASEMPRTIMPAPVAAPPQPRPAPQPAPQSPAASPAAPPPEQQAPAILDQILHNLVRDSSIPLSPDVWGPGGPPVPHDPIPLNTEAWGPGGPRAPIPMNTELWGPKGPQVPIPQDTEFWGPEGKRDPIPQDTEFWATPDPLKRMLTQAGQIPPPSTDIERSERVRPAESAWESAQSIGEAVTPYVLGAAPAGAVSSGLSLPRSAAARNVSRAVQHIFSPTTVDETSLAAEASIRQETGLARRDTNIAEQSLEAWRPLVAPYIPEFQRWINATPAERAAMPDPSLLKFIDYVEGRSQGMRYEGPPEFEPLANELRGLFQERRMAIAAEPRTATVSFVEDYFPHLWKQRLKARASFSGGVKQGSGANLRQRSVPTLREGLERGFTPISSDPLDMTMRYIANMDRYLATNRVFDIGLDSGMIQWAKPGEQPEGWVKLNGRLTDKVGEEAYAPEGYATVYNNFIHPGWHEKPLAGAIYDTARRGINAVTFFKLAIPAYHVGAMALEGTVSGFANGIGKLARGDIVDGLKTIGLSATLLEKPVESIIKGNKFQKQYLGVADYGPDFEKIVDLGARAGMRAVGRGAEYRASAMDNYFKAFKRGAIRMRMADAMAGIKSPRSVLGTLASEFGSIMETVTAPVFESMIPRLKNGAFYDEMASWLKAHPASADHEQVAAARQIWDSIDNRFGEMVLDNVFWNQKAKQSLQLLVTSVGWELGTTREIGGGIADVMRGRWTPRTKYIIGLPIAVALLDWTYQYLHSGMTLTPGAGQGGLFSMGALKDAMAPRTGGTTPEGQPERAMLPGYQKDVIGFAHSPRDWLEGKVSPGASLLKDLFITNNDYFGNKISHASFLSKDWIRDYAKHIGEALTPIPFSQEYLKGTNIGGVERFAGVRPAPAYLEDKKRYDQQELRRELGRIRGEIKGTAVHAGRTTEGAAAAREKIKRLNEEADRLSKEFRRKYPSPYPSGGGGMEYREAPAR